MVASSLTEDSACNFKIETSVISDTYAPHRCENRFAVRTSTHAPSASQGAEREGRYRVAKRDRTGGSTPGRAVK